MLKISDLLKIYFKEMFSKRKDGQKKSTYIWIIVGVALISYGAGFVSTFKRVIDLSYTTNGINDTCLYPAIGLISFSSLIFAFLAGNKLSLTKKDIAILVPLPIDEKIIVRSKLVFAIIFESIFSLYIGICYLIAYLISGSITFVGIVSILVVTLLSNVLPVATISVIMLLVHNAMSKSKIAYKLAKIEQIFMIVFVAALSMSFSLLMSMNASGEESLSNMFIIYNSIMDYYPFLFLIKKGIETSNVLFSLGYVLIHFVLAVIFYLIFTKKCYKLMINSSDYAKDNSVKKIEYHNIPFKKELLRRDFKVFFSNFIMTTNVIMSPIMFNIMIVIFMFTVPASDLGMLLEYSIPVTSLFMLCMIYTPAFMPSVDINYSWILRTLPVEDKDVLNSKIKMNIIIGIISCIVLFIITSIYYLINNIFTLMPILLLLLDVLFSYASSELMLLIGLKFPDYSDDVVHKVKQSKAAGLSLLFSTLFMVFECIVIILLPFIIGKELAYSIAILITLGICFLFKKVLNTKGIKYYANFY